MSQLYFSGMNEKENDVYATFEKKYIFPIPKFERMYDLRAYKMNVLLKWRDYKNRNNLNFDSPMWNNQFRLDKKLDAWEENK